MQTTVLPVVSKLEELRVDVKKDRRVRSERDCSDYFLECWEYTTSTWDISQKVLDSFS